MKSILRITLPLIIIICLTGCEFNPARGQQRPPLNPLPQPVDTAVPSPKPVQNTAIPARPIALITTAPTAAMEKIATEPRVDPTIPMAITIDLADRNGPVVLSKIFLIALEDGGKSGPAVGCGDSLVAVEIEVPTARSALQTLLDQHDRLYGQSGLYSALYQSQLTISRFEKKGGKVEVDLTGTLTLGGTCDSPRVKDQLMATIRQSADVEIPVTIRINGKLLDDVLSGK